MINTITPILYSILFVWIFYLGFAAAISVYRLWLLNKLNVWNKTLYSPLLLLFGTIDVILNYTVANIIFGVFSYNWVPPSKCYTLSSRFQVYHTSLNLDGTPHNTTPFEKDFATFICEQLLNPIDPSGQHC